MIADRVVQAALKLVLEPIFEADFLLVSSGFRPLRWVHDAIAGIHMLGSRATSASERPPANASAIIG